VRTLDKFHDHDRLNFCYYCGNPIYALDELEEGLCHGCMEKLDDRLPTHDYEIKRIED
jgi:NMD protein affecting ribosome stability and mRNA decay